MKSPEPRLQRLLEEAPYVRLLARQLLAEEADDVEQQAWLQAIQHGGEQVETPRAWLARIVRNVATSLHRVRTRERRREPAVDAHGAVPSSAELMEHEEQRRLLVAAVDHLPQPLRAVVLLRYFDGLQPQAIAKRLGLPVTTVWNQLRRALQLLRERLDAEHGGNRRAWMLPLVPFAAKSHGVAAGATGTASGVAVGVGLWVIAMTMKTKLVTALAVVLAVAAVALWYLRDPVPGAMEPLAKGTDNDVAETSQLPRDAAAVPAEGAARREAVVVGDEAAPKTGNLVVRVRCGDDKTPVADVTVIVGRYGDDHRVDGLRQRTDASGTASFLALPPGSVAIICDRNRNWRFTDVVAGQTVALDYELAIGLHVTGIVVDAADAPVSGAWIEVAQRSDLLADAEVLATTGPDGRFVVCNAPTALLVGARAEGHSASPAHSLTGVDGDHAEVRLVLGPAAGSVDGLVVDGQGRPVAGAMARFGGFYSWASVARGDPAPLAALVRSDTEGRFRAIGIPPGVHAVVVRASGLAPWQRSCEVTAHLTLPLRIELQTGGVIRGRVLDAEGAPVRGAEVTMGRRAALDEYYATSTVADGSFRLAGLPLGEVQLEAQHSAQGRARQLMQTSSGTITECELRLSRGVELRGRIVDEAGAPVVGALLGASARVVTGAWTGGATTDAKGRFAMLGCPEGRVLTVQVHASGFEQLTRSNVTLTAPLDLVMRRAQPMTVRIKGVVLSPDGRPLPSAMVTANGNSSPSNDRMLATDAAGRFELGPMAPGRWTLMVRAKGYLDHRSEAVELAADAVHDVGEISLIDGGQAIVDVEGDRTGVWFRVHDEAGRGVADVVAENGVLVSEKLASGPHFLRVHGKTKAAMSIPFTARTGEKTSVAVKLVAGTRQRVELVAAELDPRPEAVNLDIRLGTGSLTSYRVMWPAGQPATAEFCLPPGEFTVIVSEGARQFATAAFTVGATEAPPLRLELR